MANIEQQRRWNEESGATWVRLQPHFDGTLTPWLDLLGEAAGVQDGERVLDLGCGTGATTLDAAVRCAPSGLAVGVDLSEAMIARARERAAADGIANVRFVVGDCQTDDLVANGTLYDVAISRFGVMFFDDPVAAFANIARAVRPAGRLVLTVWTSLTDQEWIMVPGAAALEHLPMPDMGGAGEPGMFAFADSDLVTDTLRSADWHDINITRHTLKSVLGGTDSLDEAMHFLLSTGPGRALFENAEPEAARRATAAIRETLAEHLTARGVELQATAWLVTAGR